MSIRLRRRLPALHTCDGLLKTFAGRFPARSSVHIFVARFPVSLPSISRGRLLRQTPPPRPGDGCIISGRPFAFSGRRFRLTRPVRFGTIPPLLRLASQRARSSIGSECMATDHKVGGSNPSGRAIKPPCINPLKMSSSPLGPGVSVGATITGGNQKRALRSGLIGPAGRQSVPPHE